MENQDVFSAPPPPPSSAASGLSDNVAGALAYVTIIPAILFLVLEPYNKNSFVRFHSFQCLALAVIGSAVHFVMVIPLLGLLVAMVADVCLFIAWVLCIVKAYQGIKFKLPIIGDFVEANLSK